MKELKKELKSKLENLEEGEIVDKVRYGKEIYHGPHKDQYKDIYLMPSEKYYPTRLLKDHLIDDELISHKTRIDGNHNNNPEGIFIAYGKDFGSDNLGIIQIYDFLPTLLHLYDIPIPSDLDGKVVMEAFQKDSDAATRNIKYKEDTIDEDLNL